MGTGTRTGIGRWPLAATGGLLVLASATACTSSRCDDPAPEPEVLGRSEVREVPDEEANVLVDLSGALSEVVRVTTTFDDDLALDVEVPAHSRTCASHAITRYGFRVPSGALAVAVSTGDGQEEAVSLVAGDSPRWVVVSLQDGFPLEVDVWTTQPLYG